MQEPVRFDETLGQVSRTGTWDELAVGTYQAIEDAVNAQQWTAAAALIRVTPEEAVELRNLFLAWPREIVDWIGEHGIDSEELARVRGRLSSKLVTEHGALPDVDVEWAAYLALTEEAAAACGAGDREDVLKRTALARSLWQRIHDYGVDLIYGLLDCAAQLCGEQVLGDVWNHLMRDWYDDHARRFDAANQPWDATIDQLKTAIVHGFHGHLSGVDRRGGMTYLQEEDRTGFRFDPCGSGGRMLRDDVTDGRPRPAEPLEFTVTTEPHDWAWNKVGVQAYCVHCCLLNVVMPIDRLGHPTRVIEPPTWPDARTGGMCTWWVYEDPSLVPDAVYEQVGRRRQGQGQGQGEA